MILFKICLKGGQKYTSNKLILFHGKDYHSLHLHAKYACNTNPSSRITRYYSLSMLKFSFQVCKRSISWDYAWQKSWKTGRILFDLRLVEGGEAFRIFVGIMEKMDFCLYRRNAMLKPLLEVFLFLLVSLVELKLNKKDKSWVTAFFVINQASNKNKKQGSKFERPFPS